MATRRGGWLAVQTNTRPFLSQPRFLRLRVELPLLGFMPLGGGGAAAAAPFVVHRPAVRGCCPFACARSRGKRAREGEGSWGGGRGATGEERCERLVT